MFSNSGNLEIFFNESQTWLLPLVVLRTVHVPALPGESAARISNVAGSAVDSGNRTSGRPLPVFSPVAAPFSCTPTWLFFFSRTTVPSSISNSPWSFKHLTCRRAEERKGSCDCLQLREGWGPPGGVLLVSPGCRDSLVASCPA